MGNLVWNIPNGYELDRNRSKEGKIVLRRSILKWEDLKTISGYYVDGSSLIIETPPLSTINNNKNIFPSIEEAEAVVALSQLLQLRNHYNDRWEADWTDGTVKHCISIQHGMPVVSQLTQTRRSLAFRSDVIAKNFLKYNSDLINIAKPLI